MSKKAWIFVAVALIASGLIIFTVVMTALGWDFTKLSTSKYETNTYEVTEAFDSITVDASTENIRFLPSENGECKIVCHELVKVPHEVSVFDGVLTVKAVDTRAWYDYIGINFSTQSVTVYLPLGEYGKLLIRSSTGDVEVADGFSFSEMDIKLSTGDVNVYASAKGNAKIGASTGSIKLEGMSAASLELSASTGSIAVKEVTVMGGIKATTSTGSIKFSKTDCEHLTAKAGTGGIHLASTVARGLFSLETGTGSIRFDASDASEIKAKTGTGSVSGTLLTGKSFEAHSSTGSIDVPDDSEGGVCEITTGTGDIKISVD